MKAIHFLLSLMAVLYVSSNMQVCAQSETDKELITQIQKQKLEELNCYMLEIANPSQDMEVRQHYINKALALFVNNGESYEANGVQQAGSQINVTTNARQQSMLAKKYLKRLLVIKRTAEINEATFVVIKKDDVIQEAGNIYKASGYIDNVLCGMQHPIYRETTRKKVVLRLDKNQINSCNNYIVLLIDVSIVSQ